MSGYAKTLADRYGLAVEFETKKEFLATANGPLAFDMIRQATKRVGLHFNHSDTPFRWGENFGELSTGYEGGMFGLGAGKSRPDLHNPDYDFLDGILKNGIAMFSELIESSLSS